MVNGVVSVDITNIEGVRGGSAVPGLPAGWVTVSLFTGKHSFSFAFFHSDLGVYKYFI